MRINTAEFQELLKTPKYDFLRTDEHLGSNIILLTLGGSIAYGTDVETSDIDFRGCALNKKDEILIGSGFEQVVNSETDTTIYSFKKLVHLLAGCNPNCIELLGCRSEHYVYTNDIGKQLLANRELFLSQRCVHTFGGYANAQLRRLENKAARTVDQASLERHILNSIENARYNFPDKYAYFDSDCIKLYVDSAVNEELDQEIFMDINFKHYPLRDYKAMWAEMNNITKEFNKITGRNKNAISHDKLAKHSMHLVRLFLMAIDLLEDGKIVTFREKDHDLLMSIRAGKYLDTENQPTKEFFELVADLENRFQLAQQKTYLPKTPDDKAINKFVATVHEQIIRG